MQPLKPDVKAGKLNEVQNLTGVVQAVKGRSSLANFSPTNGSMK